MLLQSSSPWVVTAGLFLAVPLLRKQWYEGTKSKREAENIQVDTEAKRRVLQLEVDRGLEAELDRAEQHGTAADEAQIVHQLRALGAEPAYVALSRREFFGAIGAVIAMPVGTTITVIDDPEGA